MTQTEKHTPGPWHQEGVCAYDWRGMEMARVVPRSAEIKEAAARMTKIVEAVNAYDARQELLAALKDLMWRFDDAEPECRDPDVLQARAAIAKAEGHPS